VVATVGAIVASLSLVVAGCSNSSNTVSSGGGAPGVSDTEIDVGSIANVTGPLSSDFAPVVNGVQAYFSMINDQGGVAGRKLKLVAQTDDQGSSSVDLTVAQKLVEQNHVFAIVGVGTPFFGAASYLAHNGTPTFGYVVSSDWANAPGLFGSFGSVLDYATGAPGYAYIAKQLNAQTVGVIAYGVPQSAAACQAAVTGMQGFGIHIAFQDLNFLFGSDPTADVLRMQQNHVDLLLTCIDVTGNVAFARAIQQNGLILHQVWLNGYDRSTLQQYASLVNGTYLLVQHVPFEAATVFPGKYPAIENYIREMQRYQPNHTYDETAMTGWVSADLFVTGLKMVGRNLTQKKLIAALNTLTSYTSNGLQPPIDWTTGHTQALPPYCGAYVQVQGSQFVPVFVQPNNGVFVCFNLQGDTPISPKPGTPGT
jgi:ABC-type branched-subunit amino acid transport system substrate-binding protein